MERSLRVAVVGGAPVLRGGIALQLRLRGVTVPAAVPGLTMLDLSTVDAVVMLTDPRRDPQMLAPILNRGICVVALSDTGTRRLAPVPLPGGGRRDLRNRPELAVPRGQLTVLPLAEITTIDVVIGYLAGNQTRQRATYQLTPTERAVHALLGQGYSNAGIARELSISPKTVEGCVSTLFVKLGLERDDPGRNRRVAAALNWVAAAS